MAINTAFVSELETSIQTLKNNKVYKRLNYLDSPQSAYVEMEGRGRILILLRPTTATSASAMNPAWYKGGSTGLRKFGAGDRKCPLYLWHLHRAPRARSGDRAVRPHTSVAHLCLRMECQRKG